MISASTAATSEEPAGPRTKLEGDQQPTADWQELPQPLLTRILSLLPPALEPLLVCKSWLSAALDCTCWWERCHLGAFLVTNLIGASGPAGEIIAAKRAPELNGLLASQGGFETLLSGFCKRAVHCRHLVIDELLHTARVPRLLAAAAQSSPRLEQLDLRGTFEGPADVERVMQDVAGLQQLTRLQLAVQTGRQPEHGDRARVQVADWAALRPLSRLARLQSLELSIWGAKGEAAPDILGSLSQLTELSIRGSQIDGDLPVVAWIQPDGSGPRLRRLALRYCGIAEASATPEALAELAKLKLTAVRGAAALGDALPELQRLTALSIESPPQMAGEVAAAEQEAAIDLVAGAVACQPLHKLKLGRFQLVFSAVEWDFPHGSYLTQLTALKLAYSFGPLLLPPSWCGLPALERLVVTACPNYNDAAPELPAEFSNLQSLQHLDLNMLDFGGLPPAVAALQHLTRLGICLSAVCDEQTLAAAAFLPSLRDLILYAPEPSGQEEEEEDDPEVFMLPGTLALATCLEQLDLGPCRSDLELEEGDAELLSSLPALRKLVLPCRQPSGEGEGQDEDEAEWQAEQQEVAAHLHLALGAAGVAVEECASEGHPSI